jgi:hypothetical protein
MTQFAKPLPLSAWTLWPETTGITIFLPDQHCLSLCMNEVYGSEIDVLSWNFALADRDFKYRAVLFGMRATLHPTKPLLMMIDSGNDDRWERFYWGEGKVGHGHFIIEALEMLVNFNFPDSLKVMQPENLPPAVRYLQCNGSFEGHRHCASAGSHHVYVDDIGAACRNEKFLVKTDCEMVQYQSDWIPGW